MLKGDHGIQSGKKNEWLLTNKGCALLCNCNLEVVFYQLKYNRAINKYKNHPISGVHS